MSGVELETALAAARGLARLVWEEYGTTGSEGMSYIADTWPPYRSTPEERTAIHELEQAGVFEGITDG
jgi:hypothetical protein